MSPIATSISGCTIRSWREGDTNSLVQHANNRAVWLNLLDTFPHPYTQADATAWIARSSSARPELHLAIEHSGSAVGGIGIDVHTGVLCRTASFGYWLGEAFWGKGIATAAVKAFTPYAISTFNLVRLEARVFSWNPASMRVLAKCGFREEARLEKRLCKDGRILDEVIYARTTTP